MVERCEINDEASFQTALVHVRQKLKELDFTEMQSAKFLTAVSELARNILKYAGQGIIEIIPQRSLQRQGLQVIAIDFGCGIADVELAMKDKFSSSGTLGQGLPGAKRLVDEFNIETSSQGTRVKITSWT